MGAIDSLAICIDKHGQPGAIFFQLTISKTHPLGGKSLLNVWRALPSEVRRVPPAIVFVVPEKQSKGYKRQAIDIEGLDVSKCNPTQWPQFALGLDDKTLWDCTPKTTTPGTIPGTTLGTTPGTTPCMALGATSADDHDPADSGEPLGNDAATSDFQHPTDSAEELLGKGSTSARQSEDWTKVGLPRGLRRGANRAGTTGVSGARGCGVAKGRRARGP